MSWNAWQGYQRWEKPKAKKEKDKSAADTKKDKGKIPFVGYDGKSIEVQEEHSGLSHSSSSATSAEVALKEENKILKEAMRKIKEGKESQVVEEPEIATLLEKNPREDIKERQKLLNQERKTINRVEKIKASIAEEEKRFASWKRYMETGLKQEEQRHGSALKELYAELKEAEQSGKEADAAMDASDAAQSEELREVKSQLNSFMTYAAAMEKRQLQMAEQMTMMFGAMQAGFMGHNPDSPQHPFATKEEEKHPEDSRERSLGGSDRSRSGKREREETEAEQEEWMQQEIPADELTAEIGRLSEPMQTVVLHHMKEKPAAFKTRRAFADLLMKVESGEEICVEPAMRPMRFTKALLPFGKAPRVKTKEGISPYRTPPMSRHRERLKSPTQVNALEDLDP